MTSCGDGIVRQRRACTYYTQRSSIWQLHAQDQLVTGGEAAGFWEQWQQLEYMGRGTEGIRLLAGCTLAGRSAAHFKRLRSFSFTKGEEVES